jgi:predicted alpha/beta superfamily hydrolase
MRPFRLTVVLGVLTALACAQNPPCKSTVTGALEIVELTSKIFGNTRNLRVWLPPGYSDAANTSKRYPVLYMLDGQNLFDACTAFDKVHEWQIDETITRLVSDGKVMPLIVVGIDNAGGRRAFEYLPYRDTVSSPRAPEPGGKQFPDFMGTEVIPFIAARYRIAAGPQAIGGSSYGAIAALYAILNRPDLFNAALIESPSLQVGNGQFLRDTDHLFRGPARVVLGVGDSEYPRGADNPDNLGFVRAFRMLEANLKAAAQRPPQVLTVVQPGAAHNEAAWASRFPAAIQFLFPQQ